MGIDGIGKPGAGAPPSAIDSPEAVAAGEAAVPDTEAAVAPLRGSEALAQLQRGELTLGGYLDHRVAEATSHLQGKIAPEALDFVRRSLREQLRTDPVLGELVRRTTGSSPDEPAR